MLGKYIIYEINSGQTRFIIFDKITDHSEILRSLGEEITLISAGFCGINHETHLLQCYGESVTLRVKSREEEDSDIIKRLAEI